MFFWDSTQCARFSYLCDRCSCQIAPGEVYRRWVWKANASTLVVMREHQNCPPDDQPEEAAPAIIFEFEPMRLAA
jgi:hypothetical protein